MKIFLANIMSRLAHMSRAIRAVTAIAGVDSYGQNFIRFKCGVQVCMGYSVGETTFAQPFIRSPYIVGTVNSAAPRTVTLTGSSTTSANIKVWNYDGSVTTSYKAYWISIGFWK